jgi:Leucine-rich repeat (LRR) protein
MPRPKGGTFIDAFRLETLDITWKQYQPERLDEFSALTNLRKLNLKGLRLESIDFLSNLKSLQHLRIGIIYMESLEVSAKYLKPIVKLSELEVLDLGRTELNSFDLQIVLQSLSILPKLRALYLPDFKPNRFALKALSHLKTLETLVLVGSWSDIDSLLDAPKLTQLGVQERLDLPIEQLVKVDSKGLNIFVLGPFGHPITEEVFGQDH